MSNENIAAQVQESQEEQTADQIVKGKANYLMYEYPSHINHGKKIIFSGVDKLYNSRINSIKLTTIYYWILLGLLCVQLILFTTQAVMSRLPNISIIILKVIGLSLCLGSQNAWKKQLWKDEEYYGLALANYSKDEPIDKTLQNEYGMKDFTSRAITGDWLRNRPSITFLLVVTICFLYFHPHDGVCGWIYQLAINALFFSISFPFRTDYRYIYIQFGGAHTFIQLIKHVLKNWIFAILLIVLVFLPSLIVSFDLIPVFHIPNAIASFLEPEGVSLIVMIITGLIVYILLLLWSCWSIKEMRKKDNKTIDNIRKGNARLTEEEFGKLSCSGQLALIGIIQNGDIPFTDQIGGLISKAHSPQIVDAILALTR